MALKRTPGHSVFLVECPFCGEDLEGEPAAAHLKQCDQAHEHGGGA
jgi:hypothetical protein